jgi:hypothetical protein
VGLLHRIFFLEPRRVYPDDGFRGYTQDGKELYVRPDGTRYVVERALIHSGDGRGGGPLFYGKVQRNVR